MTSRSILRNIAVLVLGTTLVATAPDFSRAQSHDPICEGPRENVFPKKERIGKLVHNFPWGSTQVEEWSVNPCYYRDGSHDGWGSPLLKFREAPRDSRIYTLTVKREDKILIYDSPTLEGEISQFTVVDIFGLINPSSYDFVSCTPKFVPGNKSTHHMPSYSFEHTLCDPKIPSVRMFYSNGESKIMANGVWDPSLSPTFQEWRAIMDQAQKGFAIYTAQYKMQKQDDLKKSVDNLFK